ncbi:MAG: hypothetical protein U9R42_00935 [Bacteroidota bacterium]|nr:hypothetical protein [Bacteroidota bacterium]
MKQLTREQQAVYNFQVSATVLRSVVEFEQENGQNEYIDFFDFYTGAISNFINSELNYRQGDRCAAVNMQTDLMNYSNSQGAVSNTNGIDFLTKGLESFNLFKEAQTELPDTTAEFLEVVNQYRSELKEELLLQEMKGSDVTEIAEQIDIVLDSLQIGNSGADLLNLMSEKIQELIDTRNLPTRGAETNIAVWKLIAIAVMIGVGTWVIYKCYWSRRGCSKKRKKTYNTILAIALITYGACE